MSAHSSMSAINIISPEHDYTKEIELLKKIFQNIIDHPEEKKFQDLNYEKVSKKLSKSSIDLLLEAGFVVSSCNSRLRFNEQHMQQLQYVHKLLQIDNPNQTDIVATNINASNFNHRTQIDITEENTAENFKCICGKDLVKIIDRSTIYESVACDNIHCGKTVNANDIVWHCDDTSAHPNGFDICQDCISSNSYYPDGIMMLRQLTEMNLGFPENRLLDALEKSNYDVGTAYDYLMTNMTNQASQDEKSITQDEKSITQVEILNEIDCNLSDCVQLKRLNDLLKQYTSTLSCINSTGSSNIFDEKDEYNDSLILNDFNHLLFCHKDKFEEIYNIMVRKCGGCNLSNCIMLRRNNRDRCCSNLKSVYFSDETSVIVRQQILDKIHSYYFHSIDTGYKICKKERQRISATYSGDCCDEKNEARCLRPEFKILSKIINCKRNTYIKDDNRLSLSRLHGDRSRFNMGEHNDIHDEQKNTEPKFYSYGIRYYYWDFYKNNQETDDKILSMKNVYFGRVYPQIGNVGYATCDWYIKAKFKDLKQELLDKISAISWQTVIRKADSHCQTDYAKTIECDGLDREKVFEIATGTVITREHIAAVQFYCNFDKLSAVFSATYRRINHKETDECLKKRHSSYAQLGRLLRECMECYGTNMKGVNYMKWKLYHGISQNVQFKSVCPFIKGPFSTTKSLAVAINFSANSGLIVQVGLDCYWMYDQYLCPLRQALFDCGWLSDYCNEQEILFIGGYSKFAFQTIINVVGDDYIKYVNGIRCIEAIITANENVFFSMEQHVKETQHMVFRLLSHELNRYFPDSYQPINNIPTYIEDLLHNSCQSADNAFLCAGNVKSKIGKVFNKLFFNSQNTWIDLRLIMIVFPSLKSIHFEINKDMGVDFLPDKKVLWSVISYLQSNLKTNLEEIRIQYPENEQFDKQASELMTEFLTPFAQCKWIILSSQGIISMGSIYGQQVNTTIKKGTINPLLLKLVQALKQQ